MKRQKMGQTMRNILLLGLFSCMSDELKSARSMKESFVEPTEEMTRKDGN